MLKRREQEKEKAGLVPSWKTVPESSSGGSGRSLSTALLVLTSTNFLGSRKVEGGLLSKLGGLLEGKIKLQKSRLQRLRSIDICKIAELPMT